MISHATIMENYAYILDLDCLFVVVFIVVVVVMYIEQVNGGILSISML